MQNISTKLYNGFLCRGTSVSATFNLVKAKAKLITLLFLVLPLLSLTGSESPVSPWQQQQLNNEIVNKRTRTSKHFVNGGKVSAFISPSSIHYLNGSNTWQDISTEILPQNSASHPYVSLHNSVQTYFPANPFTGYILMNAKEGAFKEKVSAIRFIDINHNVLATIPLSANVTASVDKNKITYTGFHPQMALEYSLGNDMRKFNLVIQSAGFLNNIPAGTAYISIVEEFVSENQKVSVNTENKEINIELGNTRIFKFGEPVAYDNGSSESRLNGMVSIAGNNNQYALTTNFSVQWLQNPARIFPVNLDPIVNYYPQFSTYWTGYQTSSTGKSNGMLRLTTSSTASWAKFDISALPAGATVTQATFYGYHYQTTGSNKIAEIRGLGTVEPVAASASAIFNQSYNGPSYNNNFTFGSSSYGWHTGALGGTAASDIVSLQSQGWFGVGLGYVSGTTSFMYMYGTNNSTGLTCYLEVDYYTTPCSTLPGANSVVTPTNMLCPFESAVLTLATTYSVGGITYQWQAATQSSLGPWTAVTGGTAQALNTPTTTADTWYSVVMTCTNISGSVTATAGLVQISPTTTNTVPYFESLESVTVPNKLPNCSWYSPQIGTTAQTYTSSNTMGRVPRTGNNFASFYYNPGNANYFYSNGVMLEPGITYSASVWFRTEYYGFNNWSDLSILIGPNQSTTGLVTVASTNGPAISNVYKPLSDTFSVSSPGLYYIAVRGTGGTSSSAQYLTWDDLAIEIPCSLNSPTMSISVTNTSVCQGTPVNFVATGADAYNWNTGDTGSSFTTTLNSVGTIPVIVAGTKTISGCVSSATVLMNVKPTPVIYVISNEPSVCSGEVTHITAYGAASYTWSSGGNNPVVAVMPTANTSYTVLGTNSFGCVGTGVITVTAFPLPNVTASAERQTICFGESVTLTGSGAQNYRWVAGDQFVLFGNPVTTVPAVTVNYTVTGTDGNGCESSVTLPVNVETCTGIGMIESASGAFVYPNPATNALTLETPGITDKTVDLIDVTGRIISTLRSAEQKINISLADVASGIYYLNISSGTSHEVIKVVKH
jgi:hypothetical protein